ncbi:MAG: extracellular solute-binding protein [Actinobacteria bacterium]|nr:extracellular solute-binding protein [Actinomycetota bacterium]MCG2797218.1 extracellular solute-binding protein [Cellulomonas sp.]
MHITDMRRTAVAGAFAVLALAASAACTPGGSSATSTTAASDVSTDVAAAGDVTIKISDFWGSAEGEWMASLIAGFEEKYPNVTIDRTQEDWSQLLTTLNLQLTDADGPCIASANNGWGSLGTLAKGGLVLNLDAYSEAYGWDSLIPETIARQNEFTTDFTTIGSGSLFATPVARVSMIGIYYNVDKLEALGIDPPTTLDELEAAATTAAAAGEVPFAYGSQDGGTAILLGLQALYGTADSINDYVYGDTSVTATDTGLLDAANELKTWAANGWLTPGFEGIDYNTAVANFVGGEGVFRFEYTGSLGLSSDQQSQFGYIQLPQADDAATTVGVGAAPGAMVISAACQEPDVAAAFLDYLMSEQAAQTAVDNGMIPLLHSDVTVPSTMGTLSSEAAGAAAVGESDGFVPYFDWASTTMLDTLTAQMQQMYAGKTTPEQLVEAVDADRTAGLAELAG